MPNGKSTKLEDFFWKCPDCDTEEPYEKGDILKTESPKAYNPNSPKQDLQKV